MKLVRILLATDFETADAATRLVGALSSRLQITVVAFCLDRAEDEVDPAQMRTLVEYLRQCGARVTGRREVLSAEKSTAEGILAAAAEAGADLVVLGSRLRAAPAATLLGGVSREVCRRASLPVLLVPHQASATAGVGRLLLVLTEASSRSREVEVALTLARELGCPVTAFHAHSRLEGTLDHLLGTPIHSPDRLARSAVAQLRQAGIEAELRVVSNEAGLVSEVAEAVRSGFGDLVILPAGDDEPAERFLVGTLPESVARKTGKAVLVVPPRRRHRA